MPASEDTPLSLAELAELDSLCTTVTPGPWQVIDDPEVESAWLNAAAEEDDKAVALFDYRPVKENSANARFAAAARDAVPRLVAEARHLRLRVKELLEANSNEVRRRTQALQERDDALAKLGQKPGG